jgi:hypothetical protein
MSFTIPKLSFPESGKHEERKEYDIAETNCK